jgi:cell division septal protein FtsQ
MKKRLVIASVLLVLLSTYVPQKLLFSNNFKIVEIIIDNNSILKTADIKKNLNFLNGSSLIFLNTTEIEKKLKKMDFVESFELKKIYPKKLKIRIFEKKPIMILMAKKKKFYISENFELIEFNRLKEYKDLPTVLGDVKNFKKFYINLKKINFPIKLISKYSLQESMRWDLETYKKKIIKLPSENYVKSLLNFIDLTKNNNFDKYKIFDYRINQQLILKKSN